MRYGLLSDVHANLPALRRALEFLRRAGVDAYVFAGDVVGYGPHPNECADVVAGLEGVCVAGNHDLIAADRLSADGVGALARATLEWTRTVLRPDVHDWLRSLPTTARLGDIVVAHASLADVRRYVTSDALAAEELSGLRRTSPSARVLVLGHTHRPTVFGERSGRVCDGTTASVGVDVSERWLVNPGAVGQSRDGSLGVRVGVLDAAARRLDLHSLRYDVGETRRALRRAGLPPAAVDLRPRGPRSVLGRLARSARVRRAAAPGGSPEQPPPERP